MYPLCNLVYNMSMNLNTRKDKEAFQAAFLTRAGVNFAAVKAMMDTLPLVGFYIKDAQDRIVTLNRRNCEICALKDEFDAIGRKSSDLFPDPIASGCLARDARVRKTGKPILNGTNFATVDRSPTPTVYSVFPLHDSRGRLIGTMCGFYAQPKGKAKPCASERLQPALEWMNAHDGVLTGLADLAAAANMSVTHFRRLFCETFGETPAKYAMRLRLNRARALLEETDDTVASIATDVGFYDQSHFVKAFRRIYRTSPDAYRKRHGRPA